MREEYDATVKSELTSVLSVDLVEKALEDPVHGSALLRGLRWLLKEGVVEEAELKTALRVEERWWELLEWRARGLKEPRRRGVVTALVRLLCWAGLKRSTVVAALSGGDEVARLVRAELPGLLTESPESWLASLLEKEAGSGESVAEVLGLVAGVAASSKLRQGDGGLGVVKAVLAHWDRWSKLVQKTTEFQIALRLRSTLIRLLGKLCLISSTVLFNLTVALGWSH